MTSALMKLFLQTVCRAWGLVDEYTPSQTLDEVAHLIENMRSQVFDAPHEQILTRMSAQLRTTQEAHALMAQGGASEDTLRILQERISLLESLTTLDSYERDMIAGSLSFNSQRRPGQLETASVWQPIADHPTTGGFVAQQAMVVADRLFARRDLQNQTLEMRVRIRAQKEVLQEVRGLMAPENQKIVDAKLAALETIEQEVAPMPTQGRTFHPVGSATTVPSTPDTLHPSSSVLAASGLRPAVNREIPIDYE